MRRVIMAGVASAALALTRLHGSLPIYGYYRLSGWRY